MIYYIMKRSATHYEFPFYISNDFKTLENRIKTVVKSDYTISLFKSNKRLNGWYSKWELELK